MPRGSNRGGYRKPNKPAATSGPGALSQRTDGTLPVVDYPDVQYGQQQALAQQQAQAPLGGAPGVGAGMAPTQAPDVFAPTELPGEPITEGVPYGAGAGPRTSPIDSTQLFLEAMYANNPHPIIAELINTKSP